MELIGVCDVPGDAGSPLTSNAPTPEVCELGVLSVAVRPK
jgi:hypothetical protein